MTGLEPRPLAETFSAWLANAMRSAGLEIDRQRGGGRTELAEAVGVSSTTTGRWLDGKSLPGVEHLEGIARALNVHPIDMLTGSGILAAAQAPTTQGQPSPEDANVVPFALRPRRTRESVDSEQTTAGRHAAEDVPPIRWQFNGWLVYHALHALPALAEEAERACIAAISGATGVRDNELVDAFNGAPLSFDAARRIGHRLGVEPREILLRTFSLNGQLEQEQALLGMALTQVDGAVQALAELHAEDLAFGPHRAVREAIVELHSQGDAVAPTTVSTELDAKGLLRECGGPGYILTLTTDFATRTKHGGPQSVAQAIRENAATRRAFGI